jgi:hypothetical protein
VTVSDICLEDSTPATSIVTISEVGTIILAARDMLRINDEMEVQVEIRDQSGNQFPVEQLGRMDLSAHTDNDIISVEKRDGRFLVRGTICLPSYVQPTPRPHAHGLFSPRSQETASVSPESPLPRGPRTDALSRASPRR